MRSSWIRVGHKPNDRDRERKRILDTRERVM